MKNKESNRIKNINFLLENWDVLNMEEIKKVYSNRGVF